MGWLYNIYVNGPLYLSLYLPTGLNFSKKHMLTKNNRLYGARMHGAHKGHDIFVSTHFI